MKKITKILLFTFLASCSTLLFAQAKQVDTLKVMFVQNAKSASITPIKNQKQKYKLTLKGLPKNISYFSDRPRRVAGLMPMAKYLEVWNQNTPNSYKSNPPNVAIETAKLTKSIIGSLSAPKYDAKHHSMTYTLTVINKPLKLADSNNMGPVSLFIDPTMVHWNPGGF